MLALLAQQVVLLADGQTELDAREVPVPAHHDQERGAVQVVGQLALVLQEQARKVWGKLLELPQNWLPGAGEVL